MVYIRGFVFKPSCSKRALNGAAEVKEEIQQIEQASAGWQAALQGKIEQLKQEWLIERTN